MECQVCTMDPVVKALAELTRTYSVTAREYDKDGKPIKPASPAAEQKPRELNPVETKIVRELSKKLPRDPEKRKDRKRVVALLRAFADDFAKLAKQAAAIMPKIYPLCLQCSKCSNDDNLSHAGQVFVSTDAMASLGLVASGADPAAACDSHSDDDRPDNGSATVSSEDCEASDAAYRDFYDDHAMASTQTARDYLTAHAIRIPTSSPDTPASHLPSDVEDLLRKALSDFCQLSMFEKLLILSQWSGESFSEFGTMKWIPRELQRPQSKQLISQRWNKVVAKFPIAAVLKKSRPAKAKSLAAQPPAADGHLSLTPSRPSAAPSAAKRRGRPLGSGKRRDFTTTLISTDDSESPASILAAQTATSFDFFASIPQHPAHSNPARISTTNTTPASSPCHTSTSRDTRTHAPKRARKNHTPTLPPSPTTTPPAKTTTPSRPINKRTTRTQKTPRRKPSK